MQYLFNTKNSFKIFDLHILGNILRNIVKFWKNVESIKNGSCQVKLLHWLHSFESSCIWKYYFKWIENWKCFCCSIFVYIRTLSWKAQVTWILKLDQSKHLKEQFLVQIYNGSWLTLYCFSDRTLGHCSFCIVWVLLAWVLFFRNFLISFQLNFFLVTCQIIDGNYWHKQNQVLFSNLLCIFLLSVQCTQHFLLVELAS